MTGESPYDGAPRITEPTDNKTVEEYYYIKGMAPAGKTVYLMEVMGKDKEEIWIYRVKAQADNTFSIGPLTAGTGVGDWVHHIFFVNVDGQLKGRNMVGGTNSNRIHITWPFHKGGFNNG